MDDLKNCCAYWLCHDIRKVSRGKLESLNVKFCPECGTEIKKKVIGYDVYKKTIDNDLVNDIVVSIEKHLNAWKARLDKAAK